jgi:hypothetical protein
MGRLSSFTAAALPRLGFQLGEGHSIARAMYVLIQHDLQFDRNAYSLAKSVEVHLPTGSESRKDWILVYSREWFGQVLLKCSGIEPDGKTGI